MNLSEQDLQQLEDYWKNQLDASAKAALEKRLQEDPDFNKAAKEWKLILGEGFLAPQEELEELAEIKQRVTGYAATAKTIPVKENNKATKKVGSARIRNLLIGLSIAASFLLVLWLLPLGSNSTSNEFFAHLPRDNANLSMEKQDGKEAYDKYDYKNAYPALLEEVAAGGDSLNILYAAVAAIGSGQAAKAVPLLEPLVDAEEWQYYQADIQWYLTLAYLEIGQKIKAIELLERLVKLESEYVDQARLLLKQSRD